MPSATGVTCAAPRKRPPAARSPVRLAALAFPLLVSAACPGVGTITEPTRADLGADIGPPAEPDASSITTPDAGIADSATPVDAAAPIDTSSSIDAAAPRDASPPVDASRPVDPLALGPTLTVSTGSDPDVAVDGVGGLHVVYVRDGVTYYRTLVCPGPPGPELTVGPGDDPQVAVDSLAQPHVVFGAINYARWTGAGFSAPLVLTAAVRKPRLAIGPADRVWVSIERLEHPRILLWALDAGAIALGPVAVAEDNNGSLDCDASGTVHVMFRDFNAYYMTYRVDTGPTAAEDLGLSSDFSWGAVDPRDGSFHAVNTVRGGGGVNYHVRTSAGWGAAQTFALAEISGASPDDVGPTIGVDSAGHKYVAMTGRDSIPHYLVVDPAGAMLGVRRLDPEGGSLSGGKYRNPNVGVHPSRRGAFVAWGTDDVRVRGIGVP